MRRVSLLCIAAASALLAGCVSENKYQALEDEYNQLNAKLSGEISNDQVHITQLAGRDQGRGEQRVAVPIRRLQQTQIIVTGYTDNVPIGPELAAQGVPTNQVLSQKRAQNVADFLIAQGVKPSLVSVQGRGAADPVASNDTAQGRAKNRRVELTLAGTGN